jgi:hypothetical protein
MLIPAAWALTRRMAYTGKVTNVRGFSDKLDTVNDVPIVTGGTVWLNPTTGQEFLLVVHQGLWFGEEMENSLINPNQLRSYGLDVCDNPFDKRNAFGIDIPVDNLSEETEQFIPPSGDEKQFRLLPISNAH